MTDNALSLVGLALRAGRIELGEEPVGAACQGKRAKLLLLASDAAENSVRRAKRFAQNGGVPCVTLPATKAELGHALGRASCAMLAFTDVGMAASLMRKLESVDQTRYGAETQTLNRLAEEELCRQKEKRAHQRKVEQRKRKPWAVPPKGSSVRKMK